MPNSYNIWQVEANFPTLTLKVPVQIHHHTGKQYRFFGFDSFSFNASCLTPSAEPHKLNSTFSNDRKKVMPESPEFQCSNNKKNLQLKIWI